MNRLLSCRGAHLHFPIFRPQLTRPRCPLTPRRPTSTVGTDKTGFIDKQPGESLLYFDSMPPTTTLHPTHQTDIMLADVFPLKTAIYDIRHIVMRWDKRSVESRIKKQCLPHPLRISSPDFIITSIIPHLKDGGAFVKFISSNPAETESTIQAYLKQKRMKPWFSPFTRVRTFMVRGKPWLEDLYRFPSTRLKVEFLEGKELGQEALYALFRRYGKIADITVSPPGSKDLSKNAIIQFLRIRSATSARNCLHGFMVPEIESIAGREGGVTMRILYERTRKTHWIRDWIMSHPRIILPVIAAIITTIAVWVFDPIRTFFIRAKITRSLHFSENAYWTWIKKNTVDRFAFGKRNQELEDLSALWEERRDAIEQINGWLQESEETFIVSIVPPSYGRN